MIFSKLRAAKSLETVFGIPWDGVINSRVQLFTGYFRSSVPLPALVFTIDGIVQPLVTRVDLVRDDPSGLSHVVHWKFYVEATTLVSRRRTVHVEVFAGSTCIGQRRFRIRFRSDRAAHAPLIYFMHIPKTGGTSLRTALENRAPSLRMLNVYNEIHLGEDQARGFADTALDDQDVIAGHFDFGIHSLSARPYKYITVLRRPAAQIKSHYLHIRYPKRGLRQPDLTGYVNFEAAMEDDPFRAFDNPFTRQISGMSDARPVAREDFERAAHNIRTDFLFVGTTEDMDRCFQRVGALLGLTLDVERRNSTPVSIESEAITLEDIEAKFPDRVRFDEELCQLAAQHFA